MCCVWNTEIKTLRRKVAFLLANETEKKILLKRRIIFESKRILMIARWDQIGLAAVRNPR